MEKVVLRFDKETLMAHATIREHTIELDSPKSIRRGDRVYGGSGLPSPSELLLTSVGGCFGITVKSLLNAWRVGEHVLSDFIKEMNVQVEDRTSEREEGVSIDEVSVQATISLLAVDTGIVQKFVEKVHGYVRKWCPVSNLVSKAVPLKRRVTVIIDGRIIEAEV